MNFCGHITKWTNDIMSKTRPPASSLEKALARNRNATKVIVCSLPLAKNALLSPTRNTRQLPFHKLSLFVWLVMTCSARVGIAQRRVNVNDQDSTVAF